MVADVWEEAMGLEVPPAVASDVWVADAVAAAAEAGGQGEPMVVEMEPEVAVGLPVAMMADLWAEPKAKVVAPVVAVDVLVAVAVVVTAAVAAAETPAVLLGMEAAPACAADALVARMADAGMAQEAVLVASGLAAE